MLEVAKAAAEIGARDLHYGKHLNGLAVRLEGAAKLDNIVAMRQSLSSSAVELVSCVTAAPMPIESAFAEPLKWCWC